MKVYLFRNKYSLCVVDYQMENALELRSNALLYSVRLLWLLYDDGIFGSLIIGKNFFAETRLLTKLEEL